MKLKTFSKFRVAKKNRYEQLPLDDGSYLVLGIGQYHGMSVTDRDLFNTAPVDKAREVLLVRCSGTLISTKPFSVYVTDIDSLINEGYIKEAA